MGIAAGAERSSTQSISRLILKALGAIAIAALAFEAVHFYLRDPLHYIVDYTQKSFGGFWPRRFVLLAHIAGGTLALFVGPFQLWTGLRDRSMAIHRITGLVYIGGIVVASIFGMYLSYFTTPRSAGIGLFTLCLFWPATVLLAFRAIKQRRIESHKEWMIRGYVLTFAFVTNRYLTGLPILNSLGKERDAAIVWLCWVVPLLVTELIFEIRRGRSSALDSY